MKYNTDKYLKILLIFMFGFMNIGVVATLISMLNFEGTVKEQLLEIGIIALLTALANYLGLWAFSEDDE